MLTKESFILHLLGETEPASTAPTSKAQGHLSGFNFEDDAPTNPPDGQRQLILPLFQSAFGDGQLIPRDAVIRSADAVAKHIPDMVRYWPKTPARPHQTLLIETNLSHRELLSIKAFKSRKLDHLDIAEDALARVVAEALEGFQRGAEGLDASAFRGQKEETLCVVSISDEREVQVGRLACFGTFNAMTGGLEHFILSDHARAWDRADARERLGLIYERQFKKLGEPTWQEAFTTTDERKQADNLLSVCTRANVDEKEVQEAILDLLDTIAKGFGLRKKADAGRRLRAFPLPGEHDIGIDSEEREKKYGGTNPFSGVTLRDDQSRLLGYIVYPLKTNTEAKKLRQHLEQHNRFHNVLVVYPDANQASIELWQGREQLTGKLRKGYSQEDAADVVNLLSRFFIVSKAKVRNPAELAQELAYRARYLRRLALRQLADEPETGPLRDLYNAFKVALAHDQTEGEFADAFAQTITYGLLTARWLGNDQLAATGDRFTRQSALKYLPAASPFLNDLFKSVLSLKLDEQRGRLLWLVDDIADLLDRIDVTYVFGAGDKGSDSTTDPVIHFYEPFLAAYDKELKNKRGVFFTPRPVVSYIVRAVHEMLKAEFGLEDGLASTDTWADVASRVDGLKLPHGTKPSDAFVRVLDPATGTGTFIYECIGVIEQTMKDRWCRELKVDSWSNEKVVACWNEYVPKHLLPRLYAFELMMASYAICHLKLSFKLGETGYHFGRADRLHVHLTNTLDEPSASADPKLAGLFVTLAEQAREVDSIKRTMRFTVLIGNPPYSGLSANMTENAQRIVDSYKFVDGSALKERKLWLQDDYVKFFRFSQTAIDASGAGVVGLITNHGYIDNPTFRGMRQSLLQTLDLLCVLDIHGNALKKERAPDGSEDKNVFDIRQGVAILLGAASGGTSRVSRADLWGTRDNKYQQLRALTLSSTTWHSIEPKTPYYFFGRSTDESVSEYDGWPNLSELMPIYSSGVITARDELVLDFEPSAILDRIALMMDTSQSDQDLRRQLFEGKGSPKYAPGDSRGWKLPDARAKLRADKKWRERTALCSYRPFDKRWVYMTEWMVDWSRPEVRSHLELEDNLVLVFPRNTGTARPWEHAFVSREPILGRFFPDSACITYMSPMMAQPLALHGINARPEGNVRGLDERLTPLEKVSYIYAILHSPTYRSRYLSQLRSDFPKVPVCLDNELVARLCVLGEELISLHLLESAELDASLVELVGRPTGKVENATWSNDTVWIDNAKSIGFRNVTENVWKFQIGGYQVCEKWLKDRKGRTLTNEDIAHYQNIVISISETIRLIAEIDVIIEEYGGWPAAFATKETT
jgi:hypothetical protein